MEAWDLNKKYLPLLVVALSASIALSAPSILAAGMTKTTEKNTAGNTATPVSTAVTAPDQATNPSSNGSGDASGQSSAPTDNSTIDLSLEDALKYMETGNSALKLADSKIAIYEKQVEQALARQNAAKNAASQDEDTKKDLSLNYGRAQWTLENAKHDRETLLKTLRAQITNEYESILALQQLAANTQQQLANLEKIMDQVNLQIKLGLKVPSEIYSYNAQKSKLEAALESTNNSINSAMITLKQDLGSDLNRKLNLTSELSQYQKFDDADIDNRIAKAVKSNYDLEKYKKDIELTQTEYDIDFYYEDPIADQVQVSIEDKKATLENLPETLEVNLRTAYNNLKSLENTIAADRLTLEADKINIDLMQKSIDAGVKSSLDMIPLQNTLLNDQYTLQQDIIKYMTAVTNFRNSLNE